MPRVWENPYYNFDSIWNALLILFETISDEGWVDVMVTAMSTTRRGMQPSDGAAFWHSIYFVLYNFISAVFIKSVFVALVIENFSRKTGWGFLTADQRRWADLVKHLEQIRPLSSPGSNPARQSSLSSRCYQIATAKHSGFSKAATAALCTIVGLLITEYADQPTYADISKGEKEKLS